MTIIRQLAIFVLGAFCLIVIEFSIVPIFIGVEPGFIRKSVSLDQQTIGKLTAQLRESLGREPAADQIDLLVAHYLDNEILVNEALLLGVHRADTVVRQRALMNMRFLGVEGDERFLLKQAETLGMYRQDVVIRRRLIERMKKIIVSQRDSMVSEQTLLVFMKNNPQRYRSVEGLQLVHGYFSKTSRGDAGLQALYQDWVDGALSDRAMQALADKVLVNSTHFLSKHQQEKLFGKMLAASFSAQLKKGEQGGEFVSSIMPLHSTPGGWHFIRIVGFQLALLEELSEIRQQVLHDYQTAEKKSLWVATLLSLKGEYHVQR